MYDELKEALSNYIEEEEKRRKELEEKYLPNPPNKVCHNALLKGLRIENSFGPKPGDLNFLFETEYEKVYIWTHTENKNSSIVLDVKEEVRDLPFWKNIGSVIRLAIDYAEAYEKGISFDWQLDYKWMYYFNSADTMENMVFNNLGRFEKCELLDGKVLKATVISELAEEIELLLRDDKAYTALMMLSSSFKLHYICLICEMSKVPYHDHLTKEPEIWEHAELISSMETAIVQACRSVESILGKPPNTKNKSGVVRHKAKWEEHIGIDPDDIFEKSGNTYLEFYYDLFFRLRNPSAHSYGNIHFDLERTKTIQAQCFAALIVQGYIKKHILKNEEAIEKLHFNRELLDRVDEAMSTCVKKL